MVERDILGNPIRRGRKDHLGLGSIGNFGYDSSSTRRKSTRKKATTKKRTTKKSVKPLKRKTYTADFNALMLTQKGWCASSYCAKLNRIKQKVNILKDLDHKFPIKLWEIMEKPGNPNSRKNLQLLCPNCHRHKTAEDRKKIAQYKQKHGIKTIKKSRKTNARKKPKRQDSLGLGGFGLPKQSKRRRGEFDFGF